MFQFRTAALGLVRGGTRNAGPSSQRRHEDSDIMAIRTLKFTPRRKRERGGVRTVIARATTVALLSG
jgi:hypothetical protein